MRRLIGICLTSALILVSTSGMSINIGAISTPGGAPVRDLYHAPLGKATRSLSTDEFPITTDPAYQRVPAISSDIVVWEDKRNGNGDIYGYDLVTQTEFPITTNPADQQAPAIWGDIVVWDDRRNGSSDIYGYDLSTQTEFQITTDPADQYDPAISGDIVVWGDYRDGNRDIYGYHLSTQTEFRITTDPVDQGGPAIWGDIVVWSDNRNGNWDIYGYNLSTATTSPLRLNSPSLFTPLTRGGPPSRVTSWCGRTTATATGTSTAMISPLRQSFLSSLIRPISDSLQFLVFT